MVRAVGDPPGPPPLDHAAFGEAMGFVETEQAVRDERLAVRVPDARGGAARARARAVGDRACSSREGFTPVVPPVLVREQAMEEAGFFPTDRNQVYEVDDGELFLVGTSEVPLSALHRGEILAADALPRRYAGISSCFRREAGTYGKDTRGIFRVHQFDKVEMFSLRRPRARRGTSTNALLAIEESIVGGLGLPYRVVNIAAGDLGAAAAKKYDLEVWLPSEGRVPRAHVVLELPRLLGPPARHARAGRRRQPTRAHAERHRVRGRPHARVPLRALPGRRRRVRRARRAARPTPASTASNPALIPRTRPRTLAGGGVPERPNGTVLKTVEAQVSEGSNPSPSATSLSMPQRLRRLVARCEPLPGWRAGRPR